MNEIVKYQNDMNKLNFKGFTQTDMNMFIALVAQMKEKDVQEVKMSFSDIKTLVRYDVKKKKSKEDFIADLKQMNSHLMSVNCEIITGSKIIMFVLFPTFEIDEKEETLTVAVNSKFTWLLNEMRNYTTFELTEFIDLKSKYAKNLYRLLKQWRTNGQYVFNDLEQFRALMDVPEAYTNKKMMQKCVDVAIEEISSLDGSFKNFKCEPIYARKRGNPLDKLMFTWQAEETTQIEGQMSLDADFPQYAPSEQPKKKSRKTSSASRFNDYPQRQYTKEDFEEMERKMLEATWKQCGIDTEQGGK